MLNNSDGAKSIFMSVVDRPQAEWPSQLDKACGKNRTLRQRVEELLQAHLEMGSIFTSDSDFTDIATIDQPLTEKPGIEIGPYKLLEQIGEGGMGLVFMARQQRPVKRNVALKVIKPGMDTKQVVARFEAERQALAVMDHPNIARVIDGGTTDTGRPYFVMDLVRGLPITEYSDRHRFSTRQRLEIFVQVCQAVQHAHQKGIIHRDLKPNNVLVTTHDNTPVPKVIDFGIAKAVSGQLTEETLVTNFAQLVGTPLYMSPEQADMSSQDVDTRSDVYSLGVLLYELLTGTTPFDRDTIKNASFEELRRIIREEEPPRPSDRVSTLEAANLSTVSQQRSIDRRTLSQSLRGELDWIVMKTLEKDRARRYESANELAKDITRYLNDDPVAACPPSVVYRSRKFIRRNKSKVGAVAAGLLLLIALMGAGGWYWHQRDVQQTELKRDVGESLAAAEAVLDAGDYATVDRHLAEARTRLDAAGYREGPLRLDVHLVNERLRARRNAESQLAEFQQLRQRTHSYMYSVRRNRARETCQKALQIFGAIQPFAVNSGVAQANFDNVRLAASPASATAYDISILNPSFESPDNAPGGFGGAIPGWTDGDGSGEEAGTFNPTNSRYPLGLSDGENVAFSNGPTISQVLGEKLQANTLYTLRVDVGNRKDKENFPMFSIAVLVGGELLDMVDGTTLSVPNGEFATATVKFMASAGGSNLGLPLEIRLSTHGPTLKTRDWKEDQQYKQLAAEQQAKLDEAIIELLFVQARLDLQSASLARDSQTGATDYHSALAALEAIETHGRRFPSLSRWKAAAWRGLGNEEKAREAIARAESIPPHSALDFYALAELHVQEREWEQALGDYWQALDRDPEHLLSLVGVGMALLRTKDYSGAELAFTAAIALNPETTIAYVKRGSVRTELEKHALAQSDFARAKAGDEKLAEAWMYQGIFRYWPRRSDSDYEQAIIDLTEAIRLEPDNDRAYRNRGHAYRALKKYNEAIADYTECLRVNPESVGYHVDRANTYKLAGQTELAEQDYRKAVSFEAKSADAYTAHGRAFAEIGQLDDSIAALSKAIELEPQNAETFYSRGVTYSLNGEREKAIADYSEAVRHDPTYALAWNNLGNNYLDQGRNDEALIDFNKAIELDPKMAMAYSNRGIIYQRLGQFDKSLADHNEAIRLDPKFAGGYASRGSYYTNRGQPTAALADFDKAIELDPNLANAYANRGAFHQNMGEFDNAIADCTEAVRLDPSHRTAYYTRGVAYHKAGELDEALADYDEAIRLDPQHVSAHNNRGIIYETLGDLDKAIADYNEALRINPKHASAYNGRGNAYGNLGDLEKALADYDEAIQIDPKSAGYHYNRGNAYYNLGDLGSAIADYDESIQLDPDDAAYYGNRGNAYRKQGEIDSAIADYDEAIQLDPNYAIAYWNRGIAHEHRGEIDNAFADYNKAIRLDPKFSAAYNSRGIAHRKQGEFDKAIADYDEAIRLDPKDAIAYSNRGNAYRARGEIDKAIADFDEAIRLDPDAAAAYSNRGNAYDDLNDIDQALADYNEAIRLEPDDAAAYNNRGGVHWDLGDFDKALADYTEAIRLAPSVAMLYRNRGHLNYELGELDDALTGCDEAVRIDPKYVRGYCSRAAVLTAMGQIQQAKDDIAAADKLTDNNADDSNEVAWLLLTIEDSRLRDTDRAKELAEQAVKLLPKNGSYWRTLGVARYRTGDWQGAVDALNKSMEFQHGGDAAARSVLAMARWQLGEETEARKQYDKAVAWMEERGVYYGPELRRFREEAAELLGIEDLPTEDEP